MFHYSAANPVYDLTWPLPAAPKAPDFVTASTEVGRNAAELSKIWPMLLELATSDCL